MQAFMLFLHIALAMGIFGWVIMAGRVAFAFKDKPREEALPALRLANRVERMLGPATIVVPLIGLGIVFSSNDVYKVSQAWVWLSLVLYAFAAALGPGLALKTENDLLAKLEAARPGSTPAQVAPDEIKRLQLLEGILWALLVAILIMMVWRPGAPFNINDLRG